MESDFKKVSQLAIMRGETGIHHVNRRSRTLINRGRCAVEIWLVNILNRHDLGFHTIQLNAEEPAVD
ncbi:hypothetical protein J26TS2_18960 [Shouchella clausii]|nr:hypothetical protein J26TS2_18960 [Shouchella clausii]